MPLPRRRGRALSEALNRGFTPGRAAYPTLAGRQGPGCSGPRHRGYCQVWAPSRTTRRKRLRSSLTGPDLAQRN